MGTRNLTIVISNGKTKVAQYGQWDGYPAGQGATALAFLKRLMNGNELDKFKSRVNDLHWLTPAECAIIDKDNNWDKTYPHLSRDCGADILEAIYYGTLQVKEGIGVRKEVKLKFNGLQNNEEFAADSLFCEWAYVIDLDKEVFEVYTGFNKEPLTETDRFYPLQASIKEREDKYYPVKLLASFDLNNLPTESEFLAIDKEEEETEDLPL